MILRFLISATAVFAGLTATGIALAWVLLPAEPNYYRTPHFELSVPHGWACWQEGGEFVCLEEGKIPASEIIVFASKARNEDDDLDDYESHLKTPRIFEEDGETRRSEVVHVHRRTIDGRSWVDAMHLGSEVPGYYTRYLATVTAQTGLVITVSARKSGMEDVADELEQMIGNIHVYQNALPISGARAR
ncbi:MAG: hypothetical protein ACMVY4_15505 [Minwuia sp.]|uniref:hypothetical protein n=1 Tax=Minwuia sp. TaxID=2493630 RepID=UPI003A8ACFD1